MVNTKLIKASKKEAFKTDFYQYINICDINAMDGYGKTALMYASANGIYEYVEALVKAGADLSLQNSKNRLTALHYAIKKSRFNEAYCLVEHGASIKVMDNKGKTALTYKTKISEDDIKTLYDLSELYDDSYQPNPDVIPAIGKAPNDYLTAPSLALSEVDINAYDPEHVLDWINHLAPYILQHAQRRVQIYFCLLLIYHNTNMRLELAPPKSTKGVGNYEYNTNACHSALIAFVTDFDGDGIWLRNRTTTARSCEMIRQYNHFFMNVLDSTVELHRSVNDFDIRMEGRIDSPSKIRISSMFILNAVSSGKITPLSGIELFLLAMKDEFEKIKNDYITASSKTAPSAVRKRIFQLQYQGTFKGMLDASNQLTDEAQELFGMLRLE